MSYAALKSRVARAGLLERDPVWYRRRFALTALLVVGAWSLVPLVDGVLEQAGAACLLGVAFCQVGLLAHDAAHQQILARARANRLLALLLFDGVVGLSLAWWLEKHDSHHVHSNDPVGDPDAAPVFLAYAPGQAFQVPASRRWIVRHQAFLFPLLLLLEGFNLRIDSTRAVLRGRGPYPRAEALLLSLHAALYLGALVAWLGIGHALFFVVVHHMAMGAYLGLVFATNHLGMPVLEPGHGLDFLRRQVGTSRNVRGGAWLEFLFGGLNLQVEHHLFPRMPRPNLRRARLIVRAFCLEHGIAYHEEGVVGAYREVLLGLHRAGAPLRRERGDRAEGADAPG